MLLGGGPGEFGERPAVGVAFKFAVADKLLGSYADGSGTLGAVIGLLDPVVFRIDGGGSAQDVLGGVCGIGIDRAACMVGH